MTAFLAQKKFYLTGSSNFDIIYKMKKEIQIPTKCPSCNYKLEVVNSQLFCRNIECPAQSSKKVEAFVKAMRIKGFGPKTIERLGFTHPIDLYETPICIYTEIMGEKMGEKLFEEVENSKTTTFAIFLSALSIPLIGNTASKKIASSVNNLLELFEWLDELEIGDKAKSNIRNWMNTSEFWMARELEKLLFLSNEKQKETQKRGSVCITGKLKDFSNRTEAQRFLENLGYTVVSGVSSKTNYLVDEEGKASSKRQKAEQLNIPIVTIKQLQEV